MPDLANFNFFLRDWGENGRIQTIAKHEKEKKNQSNSLIIRFRAAILVCENILGHNFELCQGTGMYLFCQGTVRLPEKHI